MSDRTLDAFVDQTPYARFLGVTFTEDEQGVLGRLPVAPHLIGNPMIPALHGGAVSAFLELTATAQLWRAGAGSPRPINLTVAYLRAGRGGREVLARAHVKRSGRRIANVQVEAWQDSASRPIALLHAHFMVD
ncbi:PaaI family thioesterase [Brevundimonas sp. 2R-24]|uniref:PaaI family thioesterase n=1 Tax=Peiella sedimenti TaxID=3061083 RepID=A0ABT8SMD6_9CAUL|nr:PaaI family thioesterase [Caulobacteraceae bacterium XZ-24]